MFEHHSYDTEILNYPDDGLELRILENLSNT